MFFMHTTPSDAPIMAGAVVGVCRTEGWVHELQPRFLSVLFDRLMEYPCDFQTLAPLSPAEVAEAFPFAEQRNEVMQLIMAVELICNPIPQHLSAAIEVWAEALEFHGDELMIARDIARGAHARATADFYRRNIVFSRGDHHLRRWRDA